MNENEDAEAAEIVERMLADHVVVGLRKPVSYLPIRTVETVLKMRLSDYAGLIEEKGGRCAIIREAACCIESGAVYAYSHDDLATVLDGYRPLLTEHGWPATPADFIVRIASEWIAEENPIKVVIEAAFGDGYPLSVKGVVLHQGRVLLLVNERDEWDLPGGRPEPGEDHRTALEREVREETGLSVEVGALLDEHLFEVLPQRFVCIVAFGCTLAGAADVTLSDEHLDLRWVPLDKLGETIAGRRLPAGYLGAIRQLISQPRSPSEREV